MAASDVTRREKLEALKRIVRYRPSLTVFIIAFSVGAAILEGIGLSFLIPIIEVAQSESGTQTTDSSPLREGFVTIYETLGIPFTLEYIIVGVAAVIMLRYAASFTVVWLREILRTNYIRDLQSDSFKRALNARVSYFDEQGSDEILNAIITQTVYAGRTIHRIVMFCQEVMLSIMYLSIALYLAPRLAFLTAALLGGITVLIRYGIEPAYTVGDRVAEANERIQELVQAGTQGIRDVKLFRMSDELFDRFETHVDQFTQSSVKLRRNEAAIDSIYQLVAAVTMFVLIYVAIRHLQLSLQTLGVFLFAMFRLSPRASRLNVMFYKIEGDLPHVTRTSEFVERLDDERELDQGDRSVPDTIDSVTFDDVSFTYDGEQTVLDGVSFGAETGEFVAFVGQSGVGKSTIVSLLSRMYRPDSGKIRANGTPIEQFDLDEWRSKIAVVRQDPFIFNDTLRYNLTIGNRDADQEQIETVCEVAQVTEFLDELPQGFDTVLGEQGVQLSGGQRQRVALARALLMDADLLVLDEATSDLDTTIEREVQSRIESHEGSNILITISHRLSTVRNADRIYAMADGNIVEGGTHEALLDNDDQYADLYSSQVRGPQ